MLVPGQHANLPDALLHGPEPGVHVRDFLRGIPAEAVHGSGPVHAAAEQSGGVVGVGEGPGSVPLESPVVSTVVTAVVEGVVTVSAVLVPPAAAHPPGGAAVAGAAKAPDVASVHGAAETHGAGVEAEVGEVDVTTLREERGERSLVEVTALRLRLQTENLLELLLLRVKGGGVRSLVHLRHVLLTAVGRGGVGHPARHPAARHTPGGLHRGEHLLHLRVSAAELRHGVGHAGAGPHPRAAAHLGTRAHHLLHLLELLHLLQLLELLELRRLVSVTAGHSTRLVTVPTVSAHRRMTAVLSPVVIRALTAIRKRAHRLT